MEANCGALACSQSRTWILIVSGIFLAMAYTPHKDMAFEHAQTGLIVELHWRLHDNRHLLPVAGACSEQRIAGWELPGTKQQTAGGGGRVRAAGSRLRPCATRAANGQRAVG